MGWRACFVSTGQLVQSEKNDLLASSVLQQQAEAAEVDARCSITLWCNPSAFYFGG
jgi:hypothetical protein